MRTRFERIEKGRSLCSRQKNSLPARGPGQGIDSCGVLRPWQLPGMHGRKNATDLPTDVLKAALSCAVTDVLRGDALPRNPYITFAARLQDHCIRSAAPWLFDMLNCCVLLSA